MKGQSGHNIPPTPLVVTGQDSQSPDCCTPYAGNCIDPTPHRTPGEGGLGNVNSRKRLRIAGEILPALVVFRLGIEPCSPTGLVCFVRPPAPGLHMLGMCPTSTAPAACEPHAGGEECASLEGRPLALQIHQLKRGPGAGLGLSSPSCLNISM